MTSQTTIRNIDPDILWDAKIYAAETKQRLGDVVTEAIHALVYEPDNDAEGGDFAGEFTKQDEGNVS